MRVADANGNASTQKWDADGAQVRHWYNLFGDRIQTTNEIGVSTFYLWDKHHLLLQSATAPVKVRSIVDGVTWNLQEGGTQQNVHTNVWDAAGRKTSEWDASWSTPSAQLNRVSYKYDLRGNVTATTQTGHGTVRSAWDALGHQIAAVDANGAAASWRYDEACQFMLLLNDPAVVTIYRA